MHPEEHPILQDDILDQLIREGSVLLPQLGKLWIAE